MAVYTTPDTTPSDVHHEHYVERDRGTGAGAWAVIAVLIVLFALLFFGTNIFGNRGNNGSTDVNIRGNIETGGGSGSGSGSTGTGATQ